MSLKELLDISSDKNEKVAMTEQRLAAQLTPLRRMIAFYRQYPDLLIDKMSGWEKDHDDTKHFHFYFYQRVFLRIVMRHRYVYATFPRRISAGCRQ